MVKLGNHRNRVVLGGCVRWIGPMHGDAGPGVPSERAASKDEREQDGQPRTGRYRVYGLESRRTFQDRRTGRMRTKTIRIDVLAYGERVVPAGVRLGTEVVVQGRLEWRLEEHNGLKGGALIIVAQNMAIMEPTDKPATEPERVPGQPRTVGAVA